MLAERTQSDPSSLSRIWTFLETKTPAMLNAADRRLAENLPAHLDGRMAARGAELGPRALGGADRLDVAGSTPATGRGISVDRANELARRSLRLEEQLASAVAPVD